MDSQLHAHHGPGFPAGSQQRLRVAAAVVWRGDRLLMTQRPPGGPLGLSWEFPGGKIEEGESPEHALVREIHEELGVEATPLELLAVETHDYPHGLEIEIAFIRCALASLDLERGSGIHDIQWWRLDEVDLGQVLAGDRGFLEQLGAKPASHPDPPAGAPAGAPG